MSSSRFRCDIHTAPCQHIREYPRATAVSQEDELRMEVKQYTPLTNVNAKPGDVTIVACHALGFPKEIYEPLFDEIHDRLHCATSSIRIRAIWIADVATCGASSVLNEGKLGNDPSYYDWARDMLLMVNHFRDRMIRPLVGLGHSMGGNMIINVALLHPRLFTSVILIEPIAKRQHHGMNWKPLQGIATKRDLWSSRAEAEKWSRRHPLYKSFDTRVLQLFIDYGFRDLPTLLHPDPKGSTNASNRLQLPGTGVTLATTRHHDASAFARSAISASDRQEASADEKTKSLPDLSSPEMAALDSPFYRPEAVLTFEQLPHLRPHCLFMYGNKSTFSLSSPTARVDKLVTTGSGSGGSGGYSAGAVEEVVLPSTGHFSVFEDPAAVAQAITPWLERQLSDWAKGEIDLEWSKRSIRERSMLDAEYLERARNLSVAQQSRTNVKARL